jgi:hypothetical protein
MIVMVMNGSENGGEEVIEPETDSKYDPTENCTWWEEQLFQCVIL